MAIGLADLTFRRGLPGESQRRYEQAAELAPAADVHEQDLAGRPAEPPPDREERQARLVVTGQDLEADAGRLLDEGEHVGAVRGLAHGGRGEREQLLDLGGRTGGDGVGHRGDDGVHTLVADRALGGEVAHEAQHGPVRRLRDGWAAAVGVDDEQVDGVRSDVQHPESHASHATASRRVTGGSQAGHPDVSEIRPPSPGAAAQQ